MPKYVTFFTYTSEAWGRMVEHPDDRAEAARAVIEGVGGDLMAFFWMMGPSDGFAVYSVPHEVAAASLGAAVAGTGQVARQETFQVLDMDEGKRALELAGAVSRSYRPPGAPRDWREGYDQLG
jgi:uncharacterized protein with GYD domain